MLFPLKTILETKSLNKNYNRNSLYRPVTMYPDGEADLSGY